MTEIIQVAAGVIINPEGLILLSVRHKNVHQGGKWEFPGGKIESGETTEAALKRELLEELNIEVISTTPFIDVYYDYPDKSIVLNVLKVLDFSGVAIGLEQQHVEWVSMDRIEELNFPDANYPILEKLLDEL